MVGVDLGLLGEGGAGGAGGGGQDFGPSKWVDMLTRCIPSGLDAESVLLLMDKVCVEMLASSYGALVWTPARLALVYAHACCGCYALGLMTGIDRRVQAEVATKDKTTAEDRDHRNKKVYDVNSDEAREIMAKQKVQGYTRDFAYIEKINYLDLYIPVPKVSAARSRYYMAGS